MSRQPRKMTCPRCEGVELQPGMTQQGVEVDFCGSCGGIWLDKGEIFAFAKRARPLIEALRDGLRQGKTGDLKCPATGKPMYRVPLFGGKVNVDVCPETEGIWLDPGELEAIMAESEAGFRLSLEERPPEEESAPADPQARLAAIAAAARPLPSLYWRSAGVLFILFALLGAVLIALVEIGILLPKWALIIGGAIVFLQFLLGPFLMDLSLRWFYQCHWANPERELPPALRDFIQRVTGERGSPRSAGMRFPRIGIIEDGAPNAFTYGHRPGNARIVLTRGIFNLLDEPEVEAVVAHEIGHAVHWDMLIMTVAYLVPLLAYYAYRTLVTVRTKGRDKTRGARLAAAAGAYAVYIASQYLILWLSRVREYYADRFAGEATGRPNDLASALVKIGYGLAGQRSEKGEAAAEEAAEPQPAQQRRRYSLEAIGALGIFDAKAARSLAVASARGTTAASLDRDNLKGAMRWELWNPWAKFYELNSTHPLIANRLDHLGRQAAARGEEPFVVFDQRKPECYWDDFLIDVAVMFLPAALLVGFLVVGGLMESPRVLAMAVAGLGVGMLVKTIYSYRTGHFPEMTVAGLLKAVKVSAIRGVPCTLKGRVIGRGVPGLIWSEDFVVQDPTGIMFLDYRQPWKLVEFLFGLLRRGKLDNAEVEATGWYRRCPMPYVELKSLVAGGKKRRCYVYYFKILVAAALAAGGIVLAMSVG